MTSVQPEFNTTAAQPEPQPVSSVQPHSDSQKQLNSIEQKAGDIQDPAQAVMAKLRRFIDKIDRE